MKKLVLAAGALALAIGASQPAGAYVGSIAGHVAPTVEAAANVTKATYGYGYRLPLPKVLWSLKKKGFWGFHNIKWLPRAYAVTANGYRGKTVRIVVSAYTGKIIDIHRVGGPGFYYKNNFGGYGW
jgi:hypothetical protein